MALDLLFLLDHLVHPAPQGSESPGFWFPVSWSPLASQSPLDFWAALDSSGPLGLVVGSPPPLHPSANGPPAETFSLSLVKKATWDPNFSLRKGEQLVPSKQ